MISDNLVLHGYKIVTCMIVAGNIAAATMCYFDIQSIQLDMNLYILAYLNNY